VLIFIVVYLIVRIIQQCLKNCFESDIMKGLDRALGFFFGVVEGIVYVGLILVILYAQPWFDATGVLQNSFFHNLLDGMLVVPTNYIRNTVINV
ncbi:MAG: CvpA family protein, partial [Treponemataceae bacterium]|nr:CvpA family protein [Treponemataceae bacterium]